MNYRSSQPPLQESKSMSRHIAYCEIYSIDIIKYYHEVEERRQLRFENLNKLNITFQERQTIISFIIITMVNNNNLFINLSLCFILILN